MKTITTIAATLFAASFATAASAADVYQAFGGNHPDLNSQPGAGGPVANQPSIGSDVDRYQGWARGNTDLFNLTLSGPTQGGQAPHIYSGADGNPDLSF